MKTDKTTRRWAWRGSLIVATLLALLLWGRSTANEEPADGDAEPNADDVALAEEEFNRGVIIRFEGEINGWLEEYFFRRLDEAESMGADLVIIEIDSGGGYLDNGFNIAERLRDIQWARTVAYIPDQAMSSAAIVALGCDDIVMDPNARIGDAGTMFFDMEALAYRYVEEKALSAVIPRLRDLAESKGRPPAFAEAMMQKDLTVLKVKSKETGEIRYLTNEEIENSNDPDDWEELEKIFETRRNKFFTATGERAVELTLAQATADNRADLERRYRLPREPRVLAYTWVDTTVSILNNPFVTGLLLLTGFICLYVEFSAPGISVAGLLSFLCFAVFFWSHFLGGTSGWLEIVLFAAGVVFLLVELFVIPGFGVSGLTGALLILASIVLASQDFVVPTTTDQMWTFAQSLSVLTGAIVSFAVAAFILSRFFGQIPVLNALALKPPPQRETEVVLDEKGKPVAAALQAGPLHVGLQGSAHTVLRPAGRAVFEDEYYDVVADGAYIDRGAEIEIYKIEGNRVVVREARDKA